MTDIEHTLLQLLAACLWDASSSAPTPGDWERVIAEAEKQSVLGLITPALPETMEDYGFIQYSLFLTYMHAQSELSAILQANGIPFVILKGAASSVYYPRPSLRTYGDIDILVAEDDYLRAKSVLAANGFTENNGERSRLRQFRQEKRPRQQCGNGYRRHEKPGSIPLSSTGR